MNKESTITKAQYPGVCYICNQGVYTGDNIVSNHDLGHRRIAHAACFIDPFAVKPISALIQELQEEATRTEPDYIECISRLKDPRTVRLLHAAMGLVTEAAEFLDVFKKYIYYGKPSDKINLREEIGDITWYQRIACDELNTNMLEEMMRNVRKLKARYPGKFTEAQALNRDLVNERKILESEPQIPTPHNALVECYFCNESIEAGTNIELIATKESDGKFGVPIHRKCLLDYIKRTDPEEHLRNWL